MNTIDALKLIVGEAGQEKRTKVGLQRVRQAAKILNLSDADLVELETFMDYRDRSSGEVYAYLTETKPKRKLAKKLDWSNVR